MTQREYLKNEYYEDVPEFLTKYEKGKRFNYKKFFASRIAYYPGAGTDGHLVDVFGASHSCHCFVYSDYMISKDDYISELYNKGFKGYDVYNIINFDVNKMFNNCKTVYLNEEKSLLIKKNSINKNNPYGFMAILSRQKELNDDHGASRLAVMFLGIDSILVYDLIFASGMAKNLFACLIQDHGFGGGYDSFGTDGIMHELAIRSNVLPKFLLMVDGHHVKGYNRVWDDYKKVARVDGSHGGMHHNYRFLFKQ